MKIVVQTSPENHLAVIYAFNDSEQVETLSTTNKFVNIKIMQLIEKYSVNEVIFQSPQSWANNFIDSIREAELSKYGKNSIEYTVIEK